MSKRNYQWKYGENDSQVYYDTYVGKDYLCVYANKAYPDTWMGMYETDKCFITIMDKTFAARQRKVSSLQKFYQAITQNISRKSLSGLTSMACGRLQDKFFIDLSHKLFRRKKNSFGDTANLYAREFFLAYNLFTQV